MNTTDYLLQHVSDLHPASQRGVPSPIALIGREGAVTYGDLISASARLAGELSALELRPGERVGILGQNSMFWVACYLAVIKLGAVAVPFATTLMPEEVQRNQGFVGCKVLCLERRQQRRFASVLADFPAVLTDEVLDQSGPSAWPQVAVDLDQDAALMATSGTTARPRMVRVTHRNIQANTNSIIEYLELTAAERIMAILPFYYCFGTSLLHTHLRVGGSVAMSNTFTYPETTLDMMEQTASTGFAGVPSTFQTLLRNSTFPKRELPALRKIQQAGGKLQSVLIQELVAARPQAQVYVMYGQTEATARLSYLPPHLLPVKLGSIGRGIPGVMLDVLDESGQPVKVGEVGEIVARGENISPGYLEDPEASADKFVAGALRTGDLAVVDEQGFIFVVDRKSDFIKSYGYRVSSQEVESCVLEVKDVVAAAAIGVPDDVAGEAITVFIVLRSTGSQDFSSEAVVETIMAHCHERLARHMVPKEVRVIKNLPLNAHGKIVKAELKKMASQGD